MKNSLHIPVFCRRAQCGYLPNGTEIVDGAFCFAGADLPDGDETLYVTDDPVADIAIPLSAKQMLFPSLDKDFESIVQQGYDSFMKWDGVLKKKVGHRHANISVNLLLWFFKFLEFCLLFLGKLIWCIDSKKTN